MDNELKDLCKWAINTAQKAGSQECKVILVKSRKVTIRYREQKPEVIKEANTQTLALEVFMNGKYSVQSTPDIRETSLEDFIQKAIRNTSYLEEDPFRSLPDPELYGQIPEIDLQKTDPVYPDFSADQRHELVREVENTCIEQGGDKLISIDSSISDQYANILTMTSNGFEGEDEGTQFSIETNMSVQGEGDRKPQGFSKFTTRMLDDLPSAGMISDYTLKNTLSQIGAKKIKTEKMPVIIENKNSRNVLSGFLEAMTGQNLQQKSSFLLDKKDKKVGSDLFTLYDEPLLPKGLGSRRFDGDGFPCKKRIMIGEGVLKDYYINWYYSRKLECSPTTEGPTNLIIPPGERSVEEIIKDLGRGILITGFIGGNSNPTTGDFSLGVFGQLFDQGQIVQPVSEMNIADNHLEFWNKLVEAANDPWPYHSRRLPSLVFSDILVAGT